jgi:hypothetical protein
MNNAINEPSVKKGFPGLIVVCILLLLIAGLAYAFRAELGDKIGGQNNGNGQEIIGGDKDEGGCLIAAGYSWCELKQKCLRTWEEPCLAADIQSLMETYLSANISDLSPEKEVLGGKFYITQFRFSDENRVTVDYEDGHIALQAEVVFTVENDQVTINDFSILDTNGFEATSTEEANAAITALTSLFAEKHGLDSSNIAVQINDSRDGYFRGSVKLSPDEEAVGAYFLAKIVDGQYQIVAEGNGEIDCNLVNDFPADMVSDCASPAAADLVD